MTERTETTAQALISYRNELIAGGFPEDDATFMARDAAGRVIQANGLHAKPSEAIE